MLNPPHAGCRFVSDRKAERLVLARDARWNADRTAIWFKRTAATLEHFKNQAASKEGAAVVWKPRDSGGATVMQLVRK